MSILIGFTINHNENEDENEKCLDMDTNIVNIISVSLGWCLYVLSNT